MRAAHFAPSAEVAPVHRADAAHIFSHFMHSARVSSLGHVSDLVRHFRLFVCHSPHCMFWPIFRSRVCMFDRPAQFGVRMFGSAYRLCIRLFSMADGLEVS